MTFLKSKFFKKTKNIIKFQYLDGSKLYVVAQPEFGFQYHLYIVQENGGYEKLLTTEDYSKIEEIIYPKSKKKLDRKRKAC